MARRLRLVLAFAAIWLLYQSAEGVGMRWLHSDTVHNVLMVSSVLAAWPLSRWLGYRGYAAYALSGAGWRHWLPVCLLLAVLAKFAAVAMGRQLGVYADAPDSGAVAWLALAASLPMLLLATFVPSLAEDILTRGFWYRAAGICWRRGAMFVLVSAAIFVLNHIYRLGEGPLEWLRLFAFGLPYAAILWRSGSLWAALGLHWGWNLGNVLQDLLLPVTTSDVAGAVGLSVAAHLVMLALVLLAPQPSLTGDTRTPANS